MNVIAAVHRLLSRKEAEGSKEAQQAIAKEAKGIRARGVWNDSTVMEMDQLIREAKVYGREVHSADVMNHKARSSFVGMRFGM